MNACREYPAPVGGEANMAQKMGDCDYEVSRLQEKQNLQTLNSRLAQYIRHIRESNQEDRGYHDSKMFLESVTMLEQELCNLKNMYESEIEKLRIQFDDTNRQKTHYEQEEKKAKALVIELKHMLQVESDKNRRQITEIQSLQRLLAQKELTIEEGRIALQVPLNDLDHLEREYQKMVRDFEELKKKFDKEQTCRQDIENQNHSLRKKLEFQQCIHEQEQSEMKDRLTSTNNTIVSLEEKLCEYSQHDKVLMETLKRVRESADEQLRAYQEESEERHNRHLSELKAQIDEDDQRIEELTEQTLKLNSDITSLRARIHELEGQVNSLSHEKQCLFDELAMEQKKSEDQAKKMECKLREMQDVLINKMRELNAARDAQIPLKTEIESFKSLIEEEERRLGICQGGFSDLPYMPQSKKKSMITDTTGPVFMPRSEGMRACIASDTAAGPVRVGSAPAYSKPESHTNQVNMVPSDVGQGNDYFNEMFKDLKLSDSQQYQVHAADSDSNVREAVPLSRSQSSPVAKQGVLKTENKPCAVGELKIIETHPEGKFIRIANLSKAKDEDCSGYMIQQNIGGSPVAVFRFPPKTKLRPTETVTVWAGSEACKIHKKPVDFVFLEQKKWGTGPEYCTLLCNRDGKAISWTQAQPKSTSDCNRASSTIELAKSDMRNCNNSHNEQMMSKEERLPEYNYNVNGSSSDPVPLRREKKALPSLSQPKHPNGTSLPPEVHPPTSHRHTRPATYDELSRIQTSRHDPIPGAPYAGAAAQRMGSASLRRYQPSGAVPSKPIGTY